MAHVERTTGDAQESPAYVAFRTRPRGQRGGLRGLRTYFGPPLPTEIFLLDRDGVAIALYEDDRARSYPSFAELLRAHRLRGDELEFQGVRAGATPAITRRATS
jgi:hypothetical protein